MSYNSVCNHTRDYTNLTSASLLSDFVNHLYDCGPNWIPLSPITIMYYPGSKRLFSKYQG